jgi:acetylornithine deacetylase/succinyl-diaminopimelate desuccinylase-like protein
MTVSPTKAHASDKRNVIPALCEITVDVRLLPGQTPEEAERELRAWLGEGDYELENVERQGGTRSPIGGPLWDAVQSFVDAEEPGAKAAPICVAGFTDSHWVRDAFGTVAYGFFPAKAMDSELAARLIHSADERVPVADLELGVRFLRHAAQAVCG